MTRKEILPKWIRFFAWLHLLCFVIPPFFIIGLFGEVTLNVFGLNYSGFSLHPIAIWATFIATLAGVVAVGILWGKDWAIKIGVPYAYMAIGTCILGFVIRFKAGEVYVPLEPALLIPFIISLKKNSERWNTFDTENEEQNEDSNKGMHDVPEKAAEID